MGFGRIDAIIMAAGKPHRDFGHDREFLCDIEVGGQPMVTRVFECLRGCQSIDEIIIVGSNHPNAGTFTRVTPQGSFADNVRAAIFELRDLRTGRSNKLPADWILICSGDLPGLNVKGVTEFLEHCAEIPEGELYAAITDKAAYNAKYGPISRTWVKLKEGNYTAGNMFLVRRGSLRALTGMLNDLHHVRKAPWKLAKLIGWGTLVRFVGAQVFPSLLSLEDVEKAVFRATGIVASTVIADPAACADIDSREQLTLAHTKRVFAKT